MVDREVDWPVWVVLGRSSGLYLWSCGLGVGLEPLLGPMLAVLGRSWALCWRSWAALWAYVGGLGAYVGGLDASWGLSGRSWA